jgi:tRNA A58 N-methylase Trm61
MPDKPLTDDELLALYAPYVARITKVVDSLTGGGVLSQCTTETLARRMVEEFPTDAMEAVDRYTESLGRITALLDAGISELLQQVCLH